MYYNIIVYTGIQGTFDYKLSSAYKFIVKSELNQLVLKTLKLQLLK